jgi:hypothetical protein
MRPAGHTGVLATGNTTVTCTTQSAEDNERVATGSLAVVEALQMVQAAEQILCLLLDVHGSRGITRIARTLAASS